MKMLLRLQGRKGSTRLTRDKRPLWPNNVPLFLRRRDGDQMTRPSRRLRKKGNPPRAVRFLQPKAACMTKRSAFGRILHRHSSDKSVTLLTVSRAAPFLLLVPGYASMPVKKGARARSALVGLTPPNPNASSCLGSSPDIDAVGDCQYKRLRLTLLRSQTSPLHSGSS